MLIITSLFFVLIFFKKVKIYALNILCKTYLIFSDFQYADIPAMELSTDILNALNQWC
jgi:hypothetical protein